mgnify:CR=1 FL=1
MRVELKAPTTDRPWRHFLRYAVAGAALVAACAPRVARVQPRGVRRRALPRIAFLLVALSLSSCTKDPGPTAVSGAANCDSMVVAVPSTAPGRLLVGYTPYGPNWVTPDFGFVRQHSSIISLHTVVNSKVPWDIFLGDYKSLAAYDADLKRDAPAWRNTLCALRAQSYPRPIYLSEEFLLDRGKGPHILPPRLDGTYPAEFLIDGISTYRSPAARKAAANLARYLVEFFNPSRSRRSSSLILRVAAANSTKNGSAWSTPTAISTPRRRNGRPLCIPTAFPFFQPSCGISFNRPRKGRAPIRLQPDSIDRHEGTDRLDRIEHVSQLRVQFWQHSAEASTDRREVRRRRAACVQRPPANND